jgi:hypothetical protein
VRPQSSSLNVAAAGASTLPTIAVAVSGRRQRRPLQSARKRTAATRMASPHACRDPNRPQLVFRPNRRNGPGWNHVVRGGRVVKAKATKRPTLNPSGAGVQTTGRVSPAVGQSKPSRTGAPVVLHQPPQPKHTDSSPPQPQSQSPVEGITDLIDNLPTSASVELTRRLLSTASSLPTGDDRPRAVLKTVILFLAEHGGAA